MPVVLRKASPDGGTWIKGGTQDEVGVRVLWTRQVMAADRGGGADAGLGPRPEAPMTSATEHIRIVEAGAELLDTAAPLFDAYRQFYKKTSDVKAARRFLADRLGKKESTLYLAYLESAGRATPAGFVHLYPTFSSLSLRRTWILSDLFVTPEARRHHVGRALMDRATQLARETGADSLILETATDNFDAQKLYEGMGYKRDTEYYRYALYV